MKMEKNEFIEKAQQMASALTGLGHHVHVTHDSDANYFEFIKMRTGEKMCLYNSDDGVKMCSSVDLRRRVKEYDTFLEVVE